MAKARKKSAKLSELQGQPDPKAPLDSAAFLKAARPVLEMLTRDLLVRADGSAGITRSLRARHAFEVEKKLTADGYEVWRRTIVVQIAAAWLLSCVFVRTLEDRGLLPSNRIAGPGATDAQHLFSQIAPYLTERDYLRSVFTELEHVPACKELFDREHNLAWRLAPSAEATKEVLGLFRVPNAETPGFRFGQSSTRFLGDLYQDLSEEVRERYALLQTPDFIEEFILDRTLEPAITEFGLEETTVIDPTCGSGHFLLGAFERLFEKWSAAGPASRAEAAVETALASVHGVDVNPYAVSIAKFRLTLAAVAKLGVRRMVEAPRMRLNVVVADSLGDGTFADLPGVEALEWGAGFDFIDETAAKRVLRKHFAAVVGNPPYITVKDEALRERYREVYPNSACRKYSLSAPFMERFFLFARPGGFVGQITANSFMKREFGKGLVERILPAEDVHLIVNTAMAFVPGHGTPTILLFGRHRAPESATVHAVLSGRGEPSTPTVASEGRVWSSIRNNWSTDGFSNEYITVERIPRERLAQHPWSLEGGGAGQLKTLLERRAERRLGDICSSMGFMAITGEDSIFVRERAAWLRAGAEADWIQPLGIGEEVRDWGLSTQLSVFFPYREGALQSPQAYPALARILWPHRRLLLNRPDFGGKKYLEAGRRWYSLHQVPLERLRVPRSLAFAEVATHNHFVFDRGTTVFNRTAPVLKLPEDASDDEHLALLAYLNSSTACFWMKRVAFQKSNHTEDRPESFRPGTLIFQFSCTALSRLPVPPLSSRLSGLARNAEDVRNRMETTSPRRLAQILFNNPQPLDEFLATSSARENDLEDELVAIQEEIDWTVYEAFRLVPALARAHEKPLRLNKDDRPFQRAFLPVDGTDPLSDQMTRWTSELAESPHLRLIETAEHKRRWAGVGRGSFAQGVRTFEERCLEALRDHVLNKFESVVAASDTALTVSEMLRRLALTPAQVALLDALAERTRPLAFEVSARAVPYLAELRFTASGIEKLKLWRYVWALQRLEDQGSRVEVPVPPRFNQEDYVDVLYWRLRGKLDVPSERFIAYPATESTHDNAAIYGWAGWDHVQRASVLAALYVTRKDDEGWDASRLRPLLEGVSELLPWLKHWHNNRDPEHGEPLGDFFEHWLHEESRTLGIARPAHDDARDVG